MSADPQRLDLGVGVVCYRREQQLNEAMGAVEQGEGESALGGAYEDSVKHFEVDSILTGTILDVINDDVIVDIGYKSEGIIDIHEFSDPTAIDPGDSVDVLLEAVEDETGAVVGVSGV